MINFFPLKFYKIFNKRPSNIKKLCLHLLILLLIIFASINNQFPDEYFFSSGDAYQVINYEIWKKKFSTLIEGESLGIHNRIFFYNFYYYPFFKISNLLNFNFSQQSSLHQFFFIYFSFLSFYFFSKTIFKKKIKEEILLFFSLAYSFNIIVYSFFWYTWAYTPIKFFYILLPIIFAFFFKFIENNELKIRIRYLILSGPFIFLLNIPFSNLSYLIFMFIFFNFYWFWRFFFSNEKKILIYLFFLYWIFLFLIISPSIFNLVYFISYDQLMVSNIWYSKIQWIKDQTAIFPKPFFLHENYLEISSTLGKLSKLNIFLILIIIYQIIKLKKISENTVILFSFLLFLFFLHNKGHIFNNDYFIKNIFTETILYALRSSDKIYIYYPFVIFFIILENIKLEKKKTSKLLFIIILIITAGSSYPLLTGGIKTKYDLTISKNNTYKNSSFIMLKKVDPDIQNISKILNLKNDYDKYNVIIYPFTGMNSPNWANYEKSKHIGIDPYKQLFKHNVVSLNDEITALSVDYIGRKWNTSEKKNWTSLVSKIYSAKYIILRRDIYDFLLSESMPKINDMILKDKIMLLYKGKNIDLYEVNEPFSNKRIYLSDLQINLKDKKEFQFFLEDNYEVIKLKNFFFIFDKNLNENYLQKIQLNSKIKTVEFIDYTKYKITIKKTRIFPNEGYKDYLILNNVFSKFWKLKCISCKNDTSKFEYRHFLANNIVNGWELLYDSDEIVIEIEYILQKYFEILLILSLFIFSIPIIVIFFKKNYL
jgi:hypothetical protein